MFTSHENNSQLPEAAVHGCCPFSYALHVWILLVLFCVAELAKDG